jgi:curli biogenesis system outer membrane secretion channel CsgG
MSPRLATLILFAACCVTYFGLPSSAQTKKTPANRNKPATQPTGRAQGVKATAPASTPAPAQAEESEPSPAPVTHSAPAATPKPPKRLIVMVPDFDAGGLPNWWGGWNIGSLFANMMVTHLSRAEGYSVVERQRMLDLLREQDASQDERFRQSNITRLGKLMGADLVAFGYLTTFSRNTSSKVFYKEYSAKISFNVRLVDISSGKLVKSAEVEYASPKDRKVSLSGKDEINPNDSEFLQSLFGKSINESVKQAVEKLTGESGSALASQPTPNPGPNTGGSNFKPPAAPPQPSGPLTGMIAAVDGETIIINRGSTHGVKVGSFFIVSKLIKEIPDPENPSIIIRRVVEEMARIKINKVDATSCDGVVVSKKVTLKERDVVELVK